MTTGHRLPRTDHAPPPGEEDPAALYDAAAEVYEAGDNERAAEMFEALNERAPNPAVAQMAERARAHAAERPGRDAAVRYASNHVALPDDFEAVVGLPGSDTHPEPERRAGTGSRTEHRWAGHPEAPDVDPLHTQGTPEAPQYTPEARAGFGASIRSMPGTHVGNEYGSTQTPPAAEPAPMGLRQAGPGAGAFATPAALPASQRASLPAPGERHRAELAPDQQEAVAGATPDAQQRQDTGPGTESREHALERQRFLSVRNAVRDNRKKNRVIALIAAMLGAKPDAVRGMVESGDEPMEDYQTEQAALRDMEQRHDQRGAQSRRDDIAERRLQLAERGADRADEALDTRQARYESQADYNALRAENLAGDTEAEMRNRDPQSAGAVELRALIEAEYTRRGEAPSPGLGEMPYAELSRHPFARSTGHRRGSGRSGGGGAGGPSLRRADRTARTVGRLRDEGYSPEQIAQMTGAEAPELANREPVVGYHRTDATPGGISDREWADARSAAGAIVELNGVLDRLTELSGEITAADAASNRALVSSKMSEAVSLAEQAQATMRDINNYGVPSQAELARMEAIVPGLTTAHGFVNGANLFRGLKTTMNRNLENRLRGRFGLERDSAGASARGRRRVPRGRRAIVHEDGRTGTAPSTQTGLPAGWSFADE